MPNPALGNLETAVTNITTVVDSAIALINGIAARIQQAIADAIANGATEAELVPVQAEADLLQAKAQALADAVAANT